MDRDTVQTSPSPVRPRPTRGRIQTFSSLRNRDYRFLWTGNLFNNGANWLQQLTVGWLVWDLSASPFLVGAVGGFRAVPFLVIGPIAGVLADRLDRRKLVLVSQTMLALTALVFAFVVWSGRVEVWHAFLYIAISGVAHSILQPVRSALVANTVPREDLANAFALHAMTITSSRLVWPAIGGYLVGMFGFTVNFFVESFLYITLAVMVIPMRTPYREETPRNRHSSPFSELVDGIKYVARDKPILQLIVMSLIPNFLLQPCIYLLPVFVGDVLNRGPEILGTLLSINGGFGFAATVVIATFGYVLGKGKTSLLALVLASIAGIMLGQSQWLALTIVAVSLMGYGMSSFRTCNMTLVQLLAPDDLRGRIQSIYHLDHGLTPLASFIIGAFAEFYSPTLAVTTVGVFALALSIYFLLAFSRIRRLD